jgi:hypothetical protein
VHECVAALGKAKIPNCPSAKYSLFAEHSPKTFDAGQVPKLSSTHDFGPPVAPTLLGFFYSACH